MLDIPQSVIVSGKRMAEFEELLARLKRQKENAEAVLSRLNAAIDLLEKAKDVLGPDELVKFMEAIPPTPGVEASRKRPRGILPPEDVAAAVRATLLEVGRPMKRGELVAELMSRQIPLSGKDKNKNLGTIIWRHPQHFVSLEGLGYWVRDVPLPGVYTPEG
ncbi:MAG: hypothetical protein C3F11_06190 [Methylocystaceae bacterium]|nr:MAG: hypothetical protein C3F11_06190 [Methylocystaceae bacterium]